MTKTLHRSSPLHSDFALQSPLLVFADDEPSGQIFPRIAILLQWLQIDILLAKQIYQTIKATPNVVHELEVVRIAWTADTTELTRLLEEYPRAAVFLDVVWKTAFENSSTHGLRVLERLLAHPRIGENCIFLIKTTWMGSAADTFRRQNTRFLRTVHSLLNQENSQRVRFLSANAEGESELKHEQALVSQMLLDLQEEYLSDATRTRLLCTPHDFQSAIYSLRKAHYYGRFGGSPEREKLYEETLLGLYASEKNFPDIWGSPINLGFIKETLKRTNVEARKKSFTSTQKETLAFEYGLLAFGAVAPLECNWLSLPTAKELIAEAPDETKINQKWNLSKFRQARTIELDRIVAGLDAIKKVLVAVGPDLLANEAVKVWFELFEPKNLHRFKLAEAIMASGRAKTAIFRQLDEMTRQSLLFYFAQVEAELMPSMGFDFLYYAFTNSPSDDPWAALRRGKIDYTDKFIVLANREHCLHRSVLAERLLKDDSQEFTIKSILDAFLVDAGCGAALCKTAELAAKNTGAFKALIGEMAATPVRLGLPPPNRLGSLFTDRDGQHHDFEFFIRGMGGEGEGSEPPTASLLEVVIAALGKLTFLVENGLIVLAAHLHNQRRFESKDAIIASEAKIESNLLSLWQLRGWDRLLRPQRIPENLPTRFRSFWPKTDLLQQMADIDDAALTQVAQWREIATNFRLDLGDTPGALKYNKEPPGWLQQFTIALPLTWAIDAGVLEDSRHKSVPIPQKREYEKSTENGEIGPTDPEMYRAILASGRPELINQAVDRVIRKYVDLFGSDPALDYPSNRFDWQSDQQFCDNLRAVCERIQEDQAKP